MQGLWTRPTGDGRPQFGVKTRSTALTISMALCISPHSACDLARVYAYPTPILQTPAYQAGKPLLQLPYRPEYPNP